MNLAGMHAAHFPVKIDLSLASANQSADNFDFVQ